MERDVDLEGRAVDAPRAAGAAFALVRWQATTRDQRRSDLL